MSAGEGPAALETKLFLDQRMPEALVLAFGRGAVAVYAHACPGEDDVRRNEDGAAVVRYSDDEAVLAVADGAGGMPAGAEAAAGALRALRRAIEKARDTGSSLRAGILDGFEQGDAAVRGLGVGAAATLAVVELNGSRLRPYHAGDSAIVVIGQRGKVKLTIVPHSPVGYAVEAGLLTPEDALHHDELNIVSNFVGIEGMRIEVGSVLELAPRDTVVVGTDGLFDNLHLKEVVELVRRGPLSDVAARLSTACLDRMRSPEAGQPSKPDDLAFLLYRPVG